MDLSFLAPWRDALRPLLDYGDRDELLAGSMTNSLGFLRLHMERLTSRLPRLVEEEHFVHAERRRLEFLTRLREALELIGLALHYDPRAWSAFLHPVLWDENKRDDPFQYDASQLQPVFRVSLNAPPLNPHGSDWTDSPADFVNVVAMLTQLEHEQVSAAYREAKAQIRSLTGDYGFRVPIQLELAPTSDVSGEMTWPQLVRNVVWTLQDETSVSGSAFQLASLKLDLSQCQQSPWIVDLLAELKLANVALSELTLLMVDNDVFSVGRVANMVSGATRQTWDGYRLVDTLRPHEVDTRSFIALCCSLSKARRLEALVLRDDFSGAGDELGLSVSWRWLGFALSNQYSLSSLRHLDMYTEDLCISKVEISWGRVRL